MFKNALRNSFLIFGFLLPIMLHAAPSRLYELNETISVAPAHIKQNKARHVKLNPGVLKNAEFTINLFGDEVLVLRSRLENHQKGSFVWVGVLASNPNSEVVFAQHKGRVSGFVRYVEGGTETIVELTNNRDNKSVLYAVNPSALPELEPPTLPKAASLGRGKKKDTPHLQDLNKTPVIQKLLVAFTPAACAARGSCDSLETHILATIASTNQGYINSGLNIRIELARLVAVDYIESGVMSSLKQLTWFAGHTDDPNGELDELHSLRAKYEADLVSLISDDANYCGVGWINANAETAFSVVNWQCLSNHSLAHELGHNQGNAHNRLNAQVPGAYDYSFGHRVCEAETGFRTIMSYVAGCDVPRVNHFSNPLVNVNGSASGIDYEISPSTAADNVSSMANTAQLVAGFMQADAERLQIDTPVTQTHMLGDAVSLTLQASSVVGRPLSFNAGNLPSGLSINATTGVISGTVSPTAIEHQRVTAYVSDGFVEVAAEFTWLVPDGVAAEDGSAEFANDACMNGTVAFIYYADYTIGYTKTECIAPPAAPEVVNPGLQTNLVGELVSVQVIASDANHDTLSYSATGLPTNLTINTTTGLISGTVSAALGSSLVTVSVLDSTQAETQVSFNWEVFELDSVDQLVPIWTDEVNRMFKLEWRYPQAALADTYQTPAYFKVRPGSTQAPAVVLPADVLLNANVGDRIWQSAIVDDFDYIGSSYWVAACVGQDVCGLFVAVNLQTATGGTDLRAVNQLSSSWINTAAGTFTLSWSYDVDYFASSTGKPDFFEIRSGLDPSATPVQHVAGNPSPLSWSSVILDDDDYLGASYLVKACKNNGDCGPAQILTLSRQQAEQDFPTPAWAHSDLTVDESLQFLLDWDSISDSRIDYFTIEEQGPVGRIVFYTETDSMALERAASGNYVFRIKACQRNRETGDRCGDYSSVINVFVREFAQMFAVTDLSWFSVDGTDDPIRLAWKYPARAFDAAISRPDYFNITYGGAGADPHNVPHPILSTKSVDDYTWISETILLDPTGGGRGEFAVRACVNNGTNAICGSAIYINPWVVGAGPVIVQTPLTQNSAEASSGPIPGGPDALKPGAWVDSQRNGSAWDFFWASELRYSALHENYGETYDLIAFWYAYQQFPDEFGNDVWLPVWFYAELKQEGEHFGGTLYYPTKTPDGEACDASNRCAVGQIEVIIDTESNTQAIVNVTINKGAGLEGIVSTNFDLSYLGDDEGIFGGGNIENAHDHFNGMWAPASASSLLDGNFATSHWIDGWFEHVTIVHFDHNGAPIWTRAKIDGRDRSSHNLDTPLTVEQEIAAVNKVHAGSVGFDESGGVYTIKYGTNPTLTNTVYPVGHPNAGDNHDVLYDSNNHVEPAGTGGRLYEGAGYEGYRKAGVWVDLDYTIGTGAGTRIIDLQIGSAGTPMVMEKWANYHDVRFFIGEQPEWITECSIPTNGECAISLNWFTDADYPDASLYIRDSNGQATFIHNSAEPTQVGYQYAVSNPGEYKFELWKHAIDYEGPGNALIAESQTLTVTDSGLESGVVDIPASPLDGSTLHDAGTDNDATVGAVTGQADVSGGAATYSIPINIPPGRQGMQPSVGISYSSRAGNGLLGMGWSLSATSSIHRCPATVAQDGYSKGVTYGDSDRLCLDGQRLINTSNPSQYWNSGSVYRTELDTFTKVVINGSGNNISFIAYSNDNKTRSYAARVKPRNALGEEVTSAWQLTEETDTAGNRVNYYYVSHGAGEQVLDYIAYTGDSNSDGNRLVKYTYNNNGRSLNSGVSDNSITYTQGYASEQTQLLTKIQTCIDTSGNQACENAELIREYKISYKHSEATSRILLTDVEECAWVAGNETCLLPTTFGWGSERPEFGFEKISDEDGNPIVPVANDPYAWNSWSGPSPIEFPIASTVGDFDGDGTREIVVVDIDPDSGKNTKYLISRTAEGAENWRLKLEFDVTSEVVYRSAGAGTYYGFGSGSVARFSDVDNDGRVDLTAIVEDASSSTGHYLAFSRWMPQGSGSAEGTLNDNFTLINTNINIPVNEEGGFPQIEWVDMNNDGRTDAILIETKSEDDEFFLHFKLYLNETDSSGLDTEHASGLDIEHTFSTTPIEFTSPNAVSWGERPQFSDFDGNGQIDFGIVSKKLTNQGNLTITNGQAAVTHIVFNPLDDPENPVFTATPVWGSTALGAFGLPSDPRETYHQMIDVNGDGLLDMLFVPNCSGGSLPVGWYLQLNLGNKQLGPPQLLAGFDPGGYSQCNAGQTIRVPTYAGLIKVGDWNNDGRTDLIVPTQIHEAICWSPRTAQGADRPIYCPDHPDGTSFEENIFVGSGPGERGPVLQIHHSGQGAEDRSTYYSAIWQFEKVENGFALRTDSEALINPDNPIVSVRSSLSDTNGDGVTEMVHQLGCLGINPAFDQQVVTPGTKCLSAPDAFDLEGLRPFYSDRARLGRGYYTTPLQQAADSTLDLLKVATNALGELTLWDYAPLSSDLSSNPERVGTALPLYTVADRTSGDSYVENGEGDHFYFASSMYVVSQMQTSNGLMSGNTPLLNKTYYGYEEAVFNNQGRGFQGFRAVHTEQETPGDTGNDIRTSTWFHQIFPLAGKIDYSETYLASDALNAATPINRSSFIWACVNSNGTLQANCDIGLAQGQTSTLGPIYQPVLESSLSTQYDLQTRAKISDALTENSSYDAYGNLLAQTQTNTDYELGGNAIMERTNTLVNDYMPADTPNWWINRLRSSQQTHRVDYLGIYQPPASLAASPEVTETLTRLIGWDIGLRKPQCNYVIAGATTATSSSDNCIQSPSNFGGSPGVRTSYFYTADGNLAEQHISATDMPQSRVTTSSYDSTGYFVASITNALNHTLNTLTDPREGQPLQVTDALGRITRFEYDPFGRELERFYPNAPDTLVNELGNHYAPRIRTRYRDAPGSNPSWVYTVSVYPDGAPAQTETRDHLNRAVQTQTEGFDGQVITTISYNARGQLVTQTAPRYAGDTVYASSFSYDALGRMLTKAEPRQTDDLDNSSLLYTHYRYHGLKAHIFSGSASSVANTASCNVAPITTSTLSNQLCVRRTYSANQQLISTTDAHGQQTRFWANALANVSLIADPAGNLTAANYNALGQRTHLFDPNMGNWQFNYNGLGELLNQTDANSQTAAFTYDTLGRLTQKITAGPTLDTVIDRWRYDDDEVPAGLPGQPGAVLAFNQFTGLLGSSTREQGGQLVYARIYRYESNKGYLPAGHTTDMQVDGGLAESYTLGIDNDPYFARPKAIIYPYTLPNGEPVFSSFIRYNKQGYITQEGGSKQYATGGFYRQVEAMNAYGSVTSELYGNGVYQDATDYAATGQLAARHVTTIQNEARLDYNYSYDRWGNLSAQETEGLSRKESFSYDQLHRLTGSMRFTNDALISEETTNYSYDILGNFTEKTDFASEYNYGENPMGNNCNGASAAGPNAVTTTVVPNGSNQYAYDANGNMLCGSEGNLRVAYDGFNKPTTIERYGEYADFSYGPDNARYAQQGTRNNVRYIDKLYERINQSTHKLYLGDYAILTYGAVDPSAGLVYQHRDRLGSMVGLSDAGGKLYTDSSRAFDAFGKPREGDWRDSDEESWPAMEQMGDLNRDDITSRGFTQHEHLNGFNLIHMNGRAYDYNLGRFLSVDPIIQFPENSQSLNPYSYIMNNPMSGTDPSGYVSDVCTGTRISAACGMFSPSQGIVSVNGGDNSRRGLGNTSKNGKDNVQPTQNTGTSIDGLESLTKKTSDSDGVQDHTQEELSLMEEVVVTGFPTAAPTRGSKTTFPSALGILKVLGGLGGKAPFIFGMTYSSSLGGCNNGVCSSEIPDQGALIMPGADIEGMRGASTPGVVSNESSDRNPKQDKILTNGDIKKLADNKIDAEDLKGGKRTGSRDLYKDGKGNIYVKPKNGAGPGDPTGINLNDLK